VDEHLHHELQKGDFQVSKEGDSLCGKKGKGCKEGMGKLAIDIIHEMWHTCTSAHVYLC
jgi:hypothetical protein